jgi:hypothetical protein
LTTTAITAVASADDAAPLFLSRLAYREVLSHHYPTLSECLAAILASEFVEAFLVLLVGTTRCGKPRWQININTVRLSVKQY